MAAIYRGASRWVLSCSAAPPSAVAVGGSAVGGPLQRCVGELPILGHAWQHLTSLLGLAPAAAPAPDTATAAGAAASAADGLLLAAPKHKVSRHRKGIRSASKHLRFIPVVAQCSQCGRVFEQHAVPSKCAEDACPAYRLRPKPARGEAAAAPAGAE